MLILCYKNSKAELIMPDLLEGLEENEDTDLEAELLQTMNLDKNMFMAMRSANLCI